MREERLRRPLLLTLGTLFLASHSVSLCAARYFQVAPTFSCALAVQFRRFTSSPPPPFFLFSRSLGPSPRSPQVFQAYDFYHLYKTHNCKVQLGGSDQWGNITAGTDLIRRLSPTTNTPGEEGDAFGITLPLLTTKGGVKFGKSAGNAIWLSADLTSPYELYQYLLQTADDEIHARMLQLTLLTTAEIDQVLAQHHSQPGARLAQRSLAREVGRLKLLLLPAHCMATAKLKGGEKEFSALHRFHALHFTSRWCLWPTAKRACARPSSVPICCMVRGLWRRLVLNL